MNFYQLIEGRESIRDYDPEKKISVEVLKRIANAGRVAPSAANRQPWEFIIVSSADMLEKVKACYQRDWFKNAPHILVVKGFADKAWIRPTDGYNAIETDLTIAMDHIILAAEYEGVGTCWIAAFDKEILYSAFELQPDEEIFAITPLGYPHDGFSKKGNKIRKDFDEVVKFL